MQSKIWAAFIAVGCAAACSSGPSGPPIDSNKALNALTAEETKSLCDWESATMTGVVCNGKPNNARVCGTSPGTAPGFQRATCKSTVGGFEACVRRQRACDAAGVIQSCFDIAFSCAPVKASQ